MLLLWKSKQTIFFMLFRCLVIFIDVEKYLLLATKRLNDLRDRRKRPRNIFLNDVYSNNTTRRPSI